MILATGGAGRVYGRSTSALINTGGGMALAFAAGVPLKDMEFVRFHPTTLYGTNILMTEGCRGEGGHLLNDEGERFMARYASKYMAEIASLMDGAVQVFRTEEELEQAVSRLWELREKARLVSLRSRSLLFNIDLVRTLELLAMVDIALAGAMGALAREESRGAHSRRDHPQRDDQAWLRHTLAYREAEGIRLAYHPVSMGRFEPQDVSADTRRRTAMKVLSPTAILGYGFPESSFVAGLRRGPDVIAVDAGSTDPGPYYLGSGLAFTDPGAVKRDLLLMVAAACEAGVPLLIGSAGSCGAAPHLRRDRDLLAEVARDLSRTLRVALVSADVPHARVRDALKRGEVEPAGAAPPLTEDDLHATTNLVAQMGVEPLVAALEQDVDVVLAGRAYDPAVFAAQAIRAGLPAGPALHMGKILECGAIAALPGSGSDSLLGTLDADGFTVEPLSQERRCTTTSVAAHTLYEKSDPLLLPGPGGHLDLSDVSFTQLDERSVRVAGSRFVPSDGYRVKLEGASPVGYRTISIAGCRDPIMIGQIDGIVAMVRERVADNFDPAADYRLEVRMYGRDAVMGVLEPRREELPHELGILIEAVAPTQERADTICGFTRSCLLHVGYPGRLATAGNLAFPFSPSDFRGGKVYRFSVYHLMRVEDPLELFPVEIVEVG